MKTRRSGKSGPEVSVIGLGCVGLSYNDHGHVGSRDSSAIQWHVGRTVIERRRKQTKDPVLAGHHGSSR